MWSVEKMADNPRPPRARSKTIEETGDRHSGSVNFRAEVWELLRRVAAHRAMAGGGRMSVSEVVNAVVEEARPKLERELAK
jgi:hypothetical protein